MKFDGNNIYPSRETVGFLKSKIRDFIKKGELNSDLFDNIYGEIKKWIALYSYSDIERYFDYIDSTLITQLGKKFGKKSYMTTKCKKLAQNVRNKQYDKGPKSFWRSEELIKLLPKFFRSRFKKSA